MPKRDFEPLPSQQKMVETILRMKYPGSWAPPPLSPVTSHNSLCPLPSDYVYLHARKMAAIEAERWEWHKKPPAELAAAYIKAVHQARKLAEQHAESEEQARFFNQSDAAADFEYWAKVEYWSLDEALALLLGKGPELVTWGAVQPYIDVSPFAERYARLRNLALRASAMSRGQAAIHPTDVLAWAAEIDIEVPQGLQDALAKRGARRKASAGANEVGTPLNTAEDGATRSWVPVARVQEDAILAKLRELGFDPLAVPPAPPGKASVAKNAVRKALPYSDEQMRKAWLRLRKDGRLKDA